MTSRIDETAVRRGETDRVGKSRRPRKWLEPGPGTAAAIDGRPPHITESTVCFSCARNTCICRLREALRPVFWHDRIVQEIIVRVLSSKVSIPVVILCGRAAEFVAAHYLASDDSKRLSSAATVSSGPI